MNILKKIRDTGDVQKLQKNELRPLCKDIRKFLVHNTSKTGGHLSSNLGVVELTVALEYVFDLPKDKIIWDVGHQTYVHKILTGRKGKFKTLRQYDGLSGFPKPKESSADAFLGGHSSTSISASLGMARGRDINNQKEHVIAVIGDGSMTGGLAYEALNNAGRTKTNLIVILNDNQMSIDDNVGAMHKHLNSLHTSTSYLAIKKQVKKIRNFVPLVGKPAYEALERIRDGVKIALLDGALFEKMGFKYIGPVDGHNLEDMVELFSRIKKMDGPIFVHVKTKKGKGYKPAEQRPDLFHGVGKFDIKTGEIEKPKEVFESWSEVFGKTMVNLSENNDKIVCITAAMCNGTGLTEFHKKYPSRFFDVGIAEQHGTTFAAGLSTQGFVPVFAVYSSFLQRAYDQIVHDVCIEKHHVVFAVDRAGIVGADGETHQGLFDLSYLSHIPNMTIMSPKNKWELEKMMQFAIEKYDGPIAVRYPKGNVNTEFKTQNLPIEYGKGEILLKGKKFCIMAVGNMVLPAYEVAKRLTEDGFRPMVVNMRFITPIDNELLDKVSKKCNQVFTVEDNIRKGGFGSTVLEYYSDKCTNIAVTNIAFPKEFVPQGEQEELYRKYGMDIDGIYKKIRDKLMGISDEDDED